MFIFHFKGHLLQITDSANQLAESENWLAAVLLIAGINFPLQLEQVMLSANGRKPTATTNHRTSLQWEMWAIIGYEFEWAFHSQFFTAGALWIGINHIFLLKPLKLVFAI